MRGRTSAPETNQIGAQCLLFRWEPEIQLKKIIEKPAGDRGILTRISEAPIGDGRITGRCRCRIQTQTIDWDASGE